MGDRPRSFFRCARVRTNVHRRDQDWFVGLVYDPNELSGVTTARPRVAGVLQFLQTLFIIYLRFHELQYRTFSCQPRLLSTYFYGKRRVMHC
jgi:hypothetical protein